MPILSQRHQNAAAFSASVLHKLYGIKLILREIELGWQQHIQPDLNWNHSEPDFMGREGPCFHCGIEQSHLWRYGPPEKPVLCNACGSRWRVRRTLDGYIPKHADREIQNCQLPSEMKPARDDQKLEVGVEVSGQDGSSACLEEEMNNISSCSGGPSSDNCMQMEETNGEADKGPLWNPDSVPRRKRSELRQRILSPAERLQRQLYNNLQEPDFENISADDEMF